MTIQGKTRALGTTLLAALVAAAACSKKEGSAPAPSASASASAAAPEASSLASATPDAAPGKPNLACKVAEDKVWAHGVDTLAGLTLTHLGDGRVGIGVSVKGKPGKLVFDKAGVGAFSESEVKAGTPLATALTKPDEREVQRVTLGVDATGGIVSYVDFIDTLAKGTRRVECTTAETGATLASFNGKSFLETEKEERALRAKLAAKAKPKLPAPPAPKPKPVVKPAPKPSAKPGAKASAAPPPKPKPAVKPAPTRLNAHYELRDCRTIVDESGAGAFVVGTDLTRYSSETGQPRYAIDLFAEPSRGVKKLVHSVELPVAPTAVETFRAPLVQKMSDGSYLLLVRHSGALMAFVLDAERNKTSGPKSYRSGFPAPPHLTVLGKDLYALGSSAVGPNKFGLWQLKSPLDKVDLPATVSVFSLGEASESEPTLVSAGNALYVAFHAGDRRNAELMLTRVDDKLAAQSAPFKLTAESERVYESTLFVVGDKLVVVYLLVNGASSDLVHKTLECGGS